MAVHARGLALVLRHRTGMAKMAFYLAVFSDQREFGFLVMVEAGILPFAFVVTVLALLAEVVAVDIILSVALVAGGLVLFIFCRALMTEMAADLAMFSA